MTEAKGQVISLTSQLSESQQSEARLQQSVVDLKEKMTELEEGQSADEKDRGEKYSALEGKLTEKIKLLEEMLEKQSESHFRTLAMITGSVCDAGTSKKKKKKRAD